MLPFFIFSIVSFSKFLTSFHVPLFLFCRFLSFRLCCFFSFLVSCVFSCFMFVISPPPDFCPPSLPLCGLNFHAEQKESPKSNKCVAFALPFSLFVSFFHIFSFHYSLSAISFLFFLMFNGFMFDCCCELIFACCDKLCVFSNLYFNFMFCHFSSFCLVLCFLYLCFLFFFPILFFLAPSSLLPCMHGCCNSFV